MCRTPTVGVHLQDAPAAWIPSLFELLGGLLVLLLKLFFEHTAKGRKMCAARLLEQQQQQEQQQGKDILERPTLDVHLESVFSDDSAADSACVVVQMKDGVMCSQSGASSPVSSSPRPRPQQPPHKGLILRLPTQKSGVAIRSAYPLSPLACQTFKPALSKQTSRHFSSPGSFREHAAVHAAQQGAGERPSNLGGLSKQTSRHFTSPGSFREHAAVHAAQQAAGETPSTLGGGSHQASAAHSPRAVGHMIWRSISEGGSNVSPTEGDKEKPGQGKNSE